VLDDVVRGKPIEDEDYLLYAKVRVLDRDTFYTIKPAYQIKGNLVKKIPEMNEAIATLLTLEEINPTDKKFMFSARTTQKDWIIIKAIEKPFINLLWIGTLMVCFGLLIAFRRRLSEQKDKSNKQKTQQKDLVA